MKKFKPFLAVSWEKDSCTFPKWASVKLDGIRCVIKDGELLARSLKPIRNRNLRIHFKQLLNLSAQGLTFDGEIYDHDLEFREIASVVNSEDKPVPPSLQFHAFDLVYDEVFRKRWAVLNSLASHTDNCEVVAQKPVNSLEEVDSLFETVLKKGYEGLILRDPEAPYKMGRSTVKQGWMLKVKPFETFDSKVLDVIERFENLSPSEVNELGYKFKHQDKDAKKGTGLASCLVTELNGVQGKVVLTGDEEFRREIWKNKESYIGRMFEWKGMMVGAKDFPRHPNFIRWREDKD